MAKPASRAVGRSAPRAHAAAAKAKPAQRWSKVREKQFLEHLAETCNVTQSLAVAGMSSSSLYKQRHQSSEFRQRWDAALAEGYAKLEAELLDHALNGKPRNDETDGPQVMTDAVRLNLLRQHRAHVTTYRQELAVAGDDVEKVRHQIATLVEKIAQSLEREHV